MDKHLYNNLYCNCIVIILMYNNTDHTNLGPEREVLKQVVRMSGWVLKVDAENL